MPFYETQVTAEEPFYLEQLADRTPRAPRILLAEDDPQMRCLLAWSLREDGYSVVEAENSIELFQYLEPEFLQAPGKPLRREFDLIISDIRMPFFSALAVLGPFRKRDAVTPVILITAFGDQLIHAEAEALGVAAVIDKPFDLGRLRAEVMKLIPHPG